MLGQIPPWLDVKPSDFVRAAQMGAEAGLQVARMNQAAQEAAEARASRAGEAAADRALRQFEMQQQMELKAQQMAEEREKSKAELESKMAYNMANLGLRKGTQSETAKRDKALEDYRQDTLKLRSDLGQSNLELRQQGLDTSANRLEALERHRSEMEALRRRQEERLEQGSSHKLALYNALVREHATDYNKKSPKWQQEERMLAQMRKELFPGMDTEEAPTPTPEPAGPNLLQRIGNGISTLFGGDETGGIQPLGQPQGIPAPAPALTPPATPAAALPAPTVADSGFPPAPLNPDDREEGKVYKSRTTGSLGKWNGKGWERYTPETMPSPETPEGDTEPATSDWPDNPSDLIDQEE
jgi:hypothetical protein